MNHNLLRLTLVHKWVPHKTETSNSERLSRPVSAKKLNRIHKLISAVGALVEEHATILITAHLSMTRNRVSSVGTQKYGTHSTTKPTRRKWWSQISNLRPLTIVQHSLSIVRPSVRIIISTWFVHSSSSGSTKNSIWDSESLIRTSRSGIDFRDAPLVPDLTLPLLALGRDSLERLCEWISQHDHRFLQTEQIRDDYSRQFFWLHQYNCKQVTIIVW